MNDRVLQHFLKTSTYTYLGPYADIVRKELPKNPRQIGLLVRKSIIHRSTLADGNVGTNADLRYGDMSKVPWWRQPEDDVLVTAVAMLAELYRRDGRGLTLERKAEDKIVVTCRFTSVLFASLLKTLGVPTRCRAVHHYASYIKDLPDKVSNDHWINEYWDSDKNKWVIADADASLNFDPKEFDPYDMPRKVYDFPADAWLAIRAGQVDPDYFYNGDGTRGAIVILWSLIYDFHAIMNDEIIYTHGVEFGKREKFSQLSSEELSKIDHLAKLMQDPDANFDELTNIWEKDKDFRMLVGGLL